MLKMRDCLRSIPKPKRLRYLTKSRPPKLQLKRSGCACSKSGAAFAAHISRTKIHASGFERTEASYFIVGADSDATRQYSTSTGFAPRAPCVLSLSVLTGYPASFSRSAATELAGSCFFLLADFFKICYNARFYGALLRVSLQFLKTSFVTAGKIWPSF